MGATLGRARDDGEGKKRMGVRMVAKSMNTRGSSGKDKKVWLIFVISYVAGK